MQLYCEQIGYDKFHRVSVHQEQLFLNDQRRDNQCLKLYLQLDQMIREVLIVLQPDLQICYYLQLYLITFSLLCSLRLNFDLGRISKDPAHRPIIYYSSTSFLSVKSFSCKDRRFLQLIICSGTYRQWRFYIGARGLSPQIAKKKGFSPPKFQGWQAYIISFAGVVTLTELSGNAVATYEATASVKYVASVKIQLAGKRQVFSHNKSTILFLF